MRCSLLGRRRRHRPGQPRPSLRRPLKGEASWWSRLTASQASTTLDVSGGLPTRSVCRVRLPTRCLHSDSTLRQRGLGFVPGPRCFPRVGVALYLLFVDESGTHAGMHPFVLGGLAIHEDDAARMQRELDKLVIDHLRRSPLNLDEYELHAHELRNAKKPLDFEKRGSIWADVPRPVRLNLLDAAYDFIANFKPGRRDLPHALFAVAVERNFR
jgi:hypothetical protein